MNKMLKYKVIFAGLIAVMGLVWAACESPSSGGGGVSFDGNWRLQSKINSCTAEDIADEICTTLGELYTHSYSYVYSGVNLTLSDPADSAQKNVLVKVTSIPAATED